MDFIHKKIWTAKFRQGDTQEKFWVKNVNKIIKTAYSTQQKETSDDKVNKGFKNKKIDNRFRGITTKISNRIAQDIDFEEIE